MIECTSRRARRAKLCCNTHTHTCTLFITKSSTIDFSPPAVKMHGPNRISDQKLRASPPAPSRPPPRPPPAAVSIIAPTVATRQAGVQREACHHLEISESQSKSAVRTRHRRSIDRSINQTIKQSIDQSTYLLLLLLLLLLHTHTHTFSDSTLLPCALLLSLQLARIVSRRGHPLLSSRRSSSSSSSSSSPPVSDNASRAFRILNYRAHQMQPPRSLGAGV